MKKNGALDKIKKTKSETATSNAKKAIANKARGGSMKTNSSKTMPMPNNGIPAGISQPKRKLEKDISKISALPKAKVSKITTVATPKSKEPVMIKRSTATTATKRSGKPKRK